MPLSEPPAGSKEFSPGQKEAARIGAWMSLPFSFLGLVLITVLTSPRNMSLGEGLGRLLEHADLGATILIIGWLLGRKAGSQIILADTSEGSGLRGASRISFLGAMYGILTVFVSFLSFLFVDSLILGFSANGSAASRLASLPESLAVVMLYGTLPAILFGVMCAWSIRAAGRKRITVDR